MRDDLLIRGGGPWLQAVISYPLMVEIIHKTHTRVAHIGRHKVLDIVLKQFWHPAVDEIARHICRACEYCQMNKTNVQHQKPPILRIAPVRPFEVVAMDLVAFPTSTQGHLAAIVVIDLYSKWATALPVKDKTSRTISSLLRCHIIPTMVRKPESILSDNGPEFCGKETERVLTEFDINHIYASPNCPSSNGAVERLNRTLIAIIKALTTKVTDWDLTMPRAVMIYNSTYHAHLKTSPSEYLLRTLHEVDPSIPVEREIINNWREGNPNFKSFSVNQKVIKEINRTGNRSSYKMMPKYDGPYTIVKVQSNGLSYELIKDSSEDNKRYKAHHRKLRPFFTLPHSLSKYIPEEHIERREPATGSYTGTTYIVSSNSEESSEGETIKSHIRNPSESPGSESSQADSVKGEREIMEVRVVGNKREKPIAQLRCSESVAYPIKHSTPKGDINVSLNDLLPADLSAIVEQVLAVQEELNEQMTNCLIIAESLSSNDVNTLDKGLCEARSSVSNTPQPQTNSTNSSFHGFNNEEQSKFTQTLKEMRAIIQASRSNIQEGRSRSESMRYSLMSSRGESPVTSTPRLDAISAEMRDFLPEMRTPQAPYSPRLRRGLRSQGRAHEVPWVQPSILERARRQLE